MAEVTHTGLYTPLLKELTGLYGNYMPEEDMLEIKLMIRKYFSEKYTQQEELLLAEIGTTDGEFSEWAHDPGK